MRASAALVGMVVIWALNFSIAKEALADLPPLAFNALRFPLAAAVLYVALRARGPIPTPRNADVFPVLTLGLLGNVLYQLFFIFGLAHSRAGTASVLLAGTPIVTAVFSVALGYESIPRRAWLGVIATFLGIGLVVGYSGATSAQGVTQDTTLGVLLLMGATVSWAAYTVGSSKLVQRYDSLSVTAWLLWAGTFGIFLLGVPDLVAIDLRAVPPQTWLAVIYAGALSVGVAYLIWHHAVKQIGNTRTSVYSNLVPVLALLAAWGTLGEVPSPGQIAGATVIIGGVTIAQLR